MESLNYSDLRKSRKDRFAVEVRNAADRYMYPEGEECELSVTYNGVHWNTICLTKSEVGAVIKALAEWVSK